VTIDKRFGFPFECVLHVIQTLPCIHIRSAEGTDDNLWCNSLFDAWLGCFQERCRKKNNGCGSISDLVDCRPFLTVLFIEVVPMSKVVGMVLGLEGLGASVKEASGRKDRLDEDF